MYDIVRDLSRFVHGIRNHFARKNNPTLFQLVFCPKHGCSSKGVTFFFFFGMGQNQAYGVALVVLMLQKQPHNNFK